MPRTAVDVAYTDQCAADCGYVEPPERLHPQGRMGSDRTWHDLALWFGENTKSWSTALMVYISRRYDRSIQTVYADIDSWMASRLKLLAQEAGEDVSFN